MKKGRRLKSEQGGYAYGAPPYGWVAVAGGLAPDAREQEARARALQLRGEGVSLRAICVILDSEGHRTRSGRPWSSGALSRILDRPAPPPESVVHVNIAPWPRLRDGRRGGGRLKLRDVGDGDHPAGTPS
ncbi:recombinase family protein [Streptomyces sp. WAC05950]